MKNRGQSTLEVTTFIIILVAAYLAMHGFLSRSIKGNWKVNVDTFSDEQYDPLKSTTDYDKTKGPAIIYKNPKVTLAIEGKGNLLDASGEIIQPSGWGSAW